MTRPLRIALTGGFGNGNFGNDASLRVVLLALRARFPNASIECICDDPEIVSGRLGIRATKIAVRPTGPLRHLDSLLLRLPSGVFNWVRAILIARRFDVMLWPGTGIFDDYRTGPLGFPAQVFRWSVVARLIGLRLVFLGVGAGPIINPLSRFFLKAAARCAHDRSYRDTGSKEFMQSIGVDESTSPVSPDVVFGAPIDTPPPVRTAAPLTIGLGVMSYRGWRIDEAIGADYREKLARFVRWAESAGHRVRFLVAEPSDMRALSALEEMLGDGVDRGGRAMVVLDDVMNAIRDCDVVIASRFHVLIAGLKLGRPCISLSYGPKHDLLMAEAGVGAFCQHADYFDFDLLVRHVETIAADPADYSAIVTERVSAMKARVLEIQEKVFAALAR
ncbi:MAG: polysaccharide pyruvyl transferase family protein [Hyphomonadaceae bacterium]|nr:polysaccharide pyruvyl transferase family protein [Hyphomonadaceae bacterium]